MNFHIIILNKNISKYAKICYMDTDTFIINIKTKDLYDGIANKIKKRFDTSHYEVNRTSLQHKTLLGNKNRLVD